MYKSLSLLKLEFRNQVKINNLIKYLILFIAFSTFSITLVSNHQDIQEFGVIISIICIPLAHLNVASNTFKVDVADGTIESLLTVFTSGQIALVKFLCLAMCTAIAFSANLPILVVLYNLNSEMLLAIILCGILLSISSSAIMCLIASVQCYFRSNTNFLSILIMPIIIPNIIMVGLALQNTDNISFIAILLGVSLIITPVAVFLSRYLIENIYNI